MALERIDETSAPGKKLAKFGARFRPMLSTRVSYRWLLGNGGVVLAAALFVGTALALASMSVHVLDLNARAEKAHSVTTLCATLVTNLSQFNVVSRSLAITHADKLFHVREQAKQSALKNFAELRRRTADIAEIAPAVLAAQKTAERRIALYEGLVDGSANSQADEAARLYFTEKSNGTLYEIGHWSGDDYLQHQKAVSSQMRWSVILAIISAIASPFFGLLGIHLLKLERESMKQRELQLELMHVQRLAIMGETSAMLAHEINQPLTAAANYLSVLRRQVESGNADKAAGVVERVEAQIRRAALILKKLRRFIEKRESERDLSDPEGLVEDAISLLGTIDGTVSIATDITPGLPQVLVDRVQLQQVLVNLMRNAIEAMEGQERRELLLSLRPYGKGAVEIALADTGPGLAPDVAARLFQPFVSTKAAGMGVGLSICHSIISQHHGQIWAEANPQGGTIFRFTLPVAAQSVAA